MQLLKQSTAATVMIGPFLDDTDGKTAETGLTISQADVRLSKNAGNMAQKGDATSCTHDELGYYTCPLSTTDTGTLGRLKLMVHESGALPVWHEFMVVPANVYDSLVGGTDLLQVDVDQVDGDATAAANLNSACDNYSATRGLAGTALPDAAADAAGGLPISDAGGLDLDTQIGTDIDAILADTNELQTDNIPGTLSTIEGKIDTIDGIVDDIVADTNELQTDDIPGTLSTIDGKIDTIDGIVDSILVDTGTTLEGHLTDIKGAGWADENLTTIDANVDSVLADTNELQTDDIPGTLTTIEGKIDTVDGNVDSILTDTAEIGAAGAGLSAVPWNAAWDAEVQSECADALTAYDPPTKAELDSGLAGLNDISADDVWDASSATLSLSFETVVDRLYRFMMNKMNITDATGAVALRNEADNGDIATQTITDDDTTTTRTALSWS